MHLTRTDEQIHITAKVFAPAVETPGASLVADDLLVEHLCAGRVSALRELYRRHSGAVLATAARVLRDSAAAGDVTQEVFIDLWRRPDRFDRARGPLSAFLCLQARRRSIDVRRANGSRARREVSVTGVEPTDSDDAAAWSIVWSASVRSAVRTLDTAQSRPIELAFFQGHSYREVAEILGEPEGTVKSRIRAGLHKLRAVLLAPEASDSTAMAPPTSARVPS